MDHVRIGVYAVTSGTAEEAADRGREGMLSVFRAHSGFHAYGLAETEEGKVVSVTLWESAEQAEEANELAASWVRENIADRVRLESTYVGDFLFYETALQPGWRYSPPFCGASQDLGGSATST
jgi:Antibiotic biosynthesis monooxygenase